MCKDVLRLYTFCVALTRPRLCKPCSNKFKKNQSYSPEIRYGSELRQSRDFWGFVAKIPRLGSNCCNTYWKKGICGRRGGQYVIQWGGVRIGIKIKIFGKGFKKEKVTENKQKYN